MDHPTATPGLGSNLDLLLTGGSVVGLADGALLDRVVAGDHAAAGAALDALIRRHGALVARVCGGILADPHAVEDATQAVFLVLIRRARSIRDPDRLASWLYGVALRTAREARAQAIRYRRHYHHPEPNPDEATMIDPTPDPSLTSIRREQAEILHRAIARLPRRYLDPVVLCDLSGLTHAEAADRLHCPVATVSSRVQRAHAKLRATLSGHRLDFETALPPVVAVGSLPRTLAASASAHRLAAQVAGTLGAAKWQATAIVALLASATVVGARASSRQDPGPNPPPMPARAATDPQVPAAPQPAPPASPTEPAPAPQPLTERDLPAVAAEAPPRFAVGLPTIRAVVDYETYTGRVAASRSVVVRSPIDSVVGGVDVAAGDLVKAGQTLFRISDPNRILDIERLRDQLKQARKQAEQIAATTRQSGDPAEVRARSKVDALAKSLEANEAAVTTVLAPFAGQVAQLSTDLGETVEAGKTPLATIIAVDPIRVDFQVDERSYVKIQRWLKSKPGLTHLPVRVALADETEFIHPGRVLFRATKFDPERKTCTLNAELPNPDGALIPGLSARVWIDYGEPHAALLVPADALFGGSGAAGNFSVWTVDSTDILHQKSVDVGPMHFGGFRQVVRGIDAKTRIVLDAGFPDLRHGGPVGHLLHPAAEPPK